jgi:hypothetical protein
MAASNWKKLFIYEKNTIEEEIYSSNRDGDKYRMTIDSNAGFLKLDRYRYMTT